MESELQANVKKLNNKSKAKKVILELKAYINKHAELEKEYCRTPSWRFLKQLKIIKKKEKLNRDYKIKMFDLGIFV